MLCPSMTSGSSASITSLSSSSRRFSAASVSSSSTSRRWRAPNCSPMASTRSAGIAGVAEALRRRNVRSRCRAGSAGAAGRSARRTAAGGAAADTGFPAGGSSRPRRRRAPPGRTPRRRRAPARAPASGTSPSPFKASTSTPATPPTTAASPSQANGRKGSVFSSRPPSAVATARCARPSSSIQTPQSSPGEMNSAGSVIRRSRASERRRSIQPQNQAQAHLIFPLFAARLRLARRPRTGLAAQNGFR